MEHISIKPVWPKSKDEIWAEKFEALDSRNEKKRPARRFPLWTYAAAAAAAVFIPLFVAACFYTVTVHTARGEQSAVQLPDRSTVTLNAESKLSYKPFVWFVQRKVTLEGEAFFEVKRGSRFCVRSGTNQVNVLGTTFNVYARTSMYRVTCLTGQVEVCVGRETAVLNPNMQAVFREQRPEITEDITHATANGWIQGKFVFVETPLSEVIAEVERQYNIHVAPGYDPNHFFTGNFSKTRNAEELLEIIGKPFGIQFSIE